MGFSHSKIRPEVKKKKKMKTKTKQKTQKSEARKQNKKIREKPLLLLHSYSNINQPPPTHPIPHTWALSSPISGPIQLLIILSQRMSTNVLIECLVLLDVFDLCTSQIWFSYWLLVSIAILIVRWRPSSPAIGLVHFSKAAS